MLKKYKVLKPIALGGRIEAGAIIEVEESFATPYLASGEYLSEVVDAKPSDEATKVEEEKVEPSTEEVTTDEEAAKPSDEVVTDTNAVKSDADISADESAEVEE